MKQKKPTKKRDTSCDDTKLEKPIKIKKPTKKRDDNDDADDEEPVQ